MAYKKEDLEEKSLEAIKKHNLFFITDVVAYLPCDRATFYNHKLDKLDTIKDALEINKIRTKNVLRSKWFNGTNATTQIVLYKLLATEEELIKLGSQFIDHTTLSKDITPIYFGVDRKENNEN